MTRCGLEVRSSIILRYPPAGALVGTAPAGSGDLRAWPASPAPDRTPDPSSPESGSSTTSSTMSTSSSSRRWYQCALDAERPRQHKIAGASRVIDLAEMIRRGDHPSAVDPATTRTPDIADKGHTLEHPRR